MTESPDARDELAELITDGWLYRAPERLSTERLAEEWLAARDGASAG